MHNNEFPSIYDYPAVRRRMTLALELVFISLYNSCNGEATEDDNTDELLLLLLLLLFTSCFMEYSAMASKMC